MIRKRLVTNAVAQMLASGSGKPVGKGKMPQADPPYYILYSLDTELSGAPLADENEDASFVYQITSVSGPDPTVVSSGGSEDQTEWLADKSREVFLARDPATGLWVNQLVIAGYKNYCRELDTEPGGTSDPADAIISYVQRFRFDLTPA